MVLQLEDQLLVKSIARYNNIILYPTEAVHLWESLCIVVKSQYIYGSYTFSSKKTNQSNTQYKISKIEAIPLHFQQKLK